MCRPAPPDEDVEDGAQPRDPASPGGQTEDLGALLRELEDVGLAAVSQLARAGDAGDAFAAIAEAHADWLGEVILNRALETVGRRG